MKHSGTPSLRLSSLLRRWLGAGALALTALVADRAPAAAPTYQPGAVLTNFTLQLRRAWTNVDGRVFAPGSPLQLTDLAGRVIFLEFFDAT